MNNFLAKTQKSIIKKHKIHLPDRPAGKKQGDGFFMNRLKMENNHLV
jgi:hypothetical protein